MGTESASSAARGTVLLVNPNSNTRTTAMMAELAREALAPQRLDVVGLTAADGPAMIIDPESLAASAAHVRTAVLDYLAGPDGGAVAAVIVSAIGDPGREALELELSERGIAVLGIGQGSIHQASRGGRRFGMATSTPLLADSLAALVGSHGKSEAFSGVRLTASEPLVLAADPEQQYRELAAAVGDSTTLDGAEAVIIAGGPLSETARRLAETTSAEIIQPIPSACSLLLERLGAVAA
ncbi:aspartate/glutamate racemase family protein [Arthrobacter cupressi]|uniref:Asp/Glu/hydantoin racemase n=1 Tax=Arthrobacter cupressi TaxID=1045773 RepID=A0A1G8K455_9MICC|nr:aspartate/glutamate racemase family protein [Arthrobacter cupressi]NYD77341.1 Asp/Glu/hydantoin racemase [Arthrobacter cupressi]SDI38157.1 Asp/Glu/hydantoin racemase [Arthrobacter cupressi]